MKDYFQKKHLGSLIDGVFHTETGERIDHISPVHGKLLKTLNVATSPLVHKAIESASEAAHVLKETSPYERARILQNIASLMYDYKDELAEIVTLEMGKPIAEAEGEVDYTLGYFEWFAEEAKRIYGKIIPSHSRFKKLMLRYDPVGTAAIITPWNFPLAMPGRKMAAAIAAGCPILVKPSHETPLSMLTIGQIALKAGLPKKAISVLVGSQETIAPPLLQSFSVRKLSFTGSTAAGQMLFEACAETIKKMTMELGGHAPLIVCEDADLEDAVQGAIEAKFRMSGQTCVCANRLLVHQNIAPKFLERFIEVVKAMKIGNPLERSTNLSRIIHHMSQKKARDHIEDALKRGAKAHLNAKEPYEPEVLTEVTPDMLVFQEETFGPVAAITTFSSDEEAIELANQTPFGLASYLFTTSLKRSEKIISGLQYGIVGLNDGLPSCPQLPFGGVKASGFGREGGSSGIYEYLVEKVVSEHL